MLRIYWNYLWGKISTVSNSNRLEKSLYKVLVWVQIWDCTEKFSWIWQYVRKWKMYSQGLRQFSFLWKIFFCVLYPKKIIGFSICFSEKVKSNALQENNRLVSQWMLSYQCNFTALYTEPLTAKVGLNSHWELRDWSFQTTYQVEETS